MNKKVNGMAKMTGLYMGENFKNGSAVLFDPRKEYSNPNFLVTGKTGKGLGFHFRKS